MKMWIFEQTNCGEKLIVTEANNGINLFINDNFGIEKVKTQWDAIDKMKSEGTLKYLTTIRTFYNIPSAEMFKAKF